MTQRQIRSVDDPARPSSASTVRTFLDAVRRSPAGMGAVLPSSEFLGTQLAAIVPARQPATVVELGPGTGALSGAVRDRLAPGSRHLAVEIDPGLVEHLRTRSPWMDVVRGDAADLMSLLEPEGVGPGEVDAIVTSLPWTLLPAAQQDCILSECCRALTPGGALSAVTYLTALPMPSARSFRERLRTRFDEVVLTGTVWRNVPPGKALLCRRPVRDPVT